MIWAHSASGLLSILNSISCITGSPRWDLNARHGQTRLSQQEPARLRHASPLNIVLKRNWLHLNRHGDKSRQHLAEVGFYRWWENRHPRRASSPRPRFGPALLHDDGAAAPLEPTDWEAGFMAVWRVEGVVKHFSFVEGGHVARLSIWWGYLGFWWVLRQSLLKSESPWLPSESSKEQR